MTERVVHSSADLDYVTDLVLSEDALVRGWRALRAAFVPGLLPDDFEVRGQALAPARLRPLPQWMSRA